MFPVESLSDLPGRGLEEKWSLDRPVDLFFQHSFYCLLKTVLGTGASKVKEMGGVSPREIDVLST